MRRSNEGRIHQKRSNQAYTSKVFSFSQEFKKDKEINIQYIDQVIMQQISLQRHFPLQLLESSFEILGCVICEIYEEELIMST